MIITAAFCAFSEQQEVKSTNSLKEYLKKNTINGTSTPFTPGLYHIVVILSDHSFITTDIYNPTEALVILLLLSDHYFITTDIYNPTEELIILLSYCPTITTEFNIEDRRTLVF